MHHEFDKTSYSYVPDLVFEEVADIETSSQEEDTEGKQQNENIADTDAADEEFEFNLFAEEPAKVVIVPDEPVALLPSGPEQVQEGVIYVEMHRPDSYYFASYSDAQKTQFEAAAVSGADILAVQGQPLQPRFLGAARGPKVIDFNEAVAQAKRDHQRMRNRRRPGKKARLIRKERYATQQEQRKQMQRQRSKQPRSFTNNSNNKSKAGATGGYKRPASTGGHPRKVKKVQT
ncbi:hypothetical protein D0Z00_000492 [Geotrichum galactomycetum]|uniref:Uncharacterized protein n=1 Tax=Geotrichum galactomycetum TaxID=27317 RepID=A0ACB6V9W8_9ASCO|nr:hypothetical protein D0Z00_000492 [Geotrichum candidum]